MDEGRHQKLILYQKIKPGYLPFCVPDSIDAVKVKQLVACLYHSEEEGEETQVKVPKTFEERKQLGRFCMKPLLTVSIILELV